MTNGQSQGRQCALSLCMVVCLTLTSITLSFQSADAQVSSTAPSTVAPLATPVKSSASKSWVSVQASGSAAEDVSIDPKISAILDDEHSTAMAIVSRAKDVVISARKTSQSIEGRFSETNQAICEAFWIRFKSGELKPPKKAFMSSTNPKDTTQLGGALKEIAKSNLELTKKQRQFGAETTLALGPFGAAISFDEKMAIAEKYFDRRWKKLESSFKNDSEYFHLLFADLFMKNGNPALLHLYVRPAPEEEKINNQKNGQNSPLSNLYFQFFVSDGSFKSGGSFASWGAYMYGKDEFNEYKDYPLFNHIGLVDYQFQLALKGLPVIWRIEGSELIGKMSSYRPYVYKLIVYLLINREDFGNSGTESCSVLFN